MRDQDRANAFASLSQYGAQLYDGNRDYNMALFQTMYKSFQKDTTSPDRHLIDLMVKKVADTNETSLIELLDRLTSEDFSDFLQENSVKKFTDSYHALQDAEQKLNPNEKQLSRYSPVEIQLTWIKKVHDEIVRCNLSSRISNEDKLVLEKLENLYNKKLDDFFINNDKIDTHLSHIDTAAKQVALEPQINHNNEISSETINHFKDFKQKLMEIKAPPVSEESLTSENPANPNRVLGNL